MKGIIVLLALVAGPVGAVDMTAKSNQELCIMRAVNLLSGDELAGSTSDIYAELARRSEPCADTALYTSIAAERVKMVNEAMAQSQSSDQALAEQAHEERAARIRAAGRAFLQMQQDQRDRVQAAPRPTTTHCRQSITGMECTTY